MSAALLLGLALLIVPWRGPARERLVGLTSPRADRPTARGLARAWLTRRFPRRRPRPPSPGYLARLVDLLGSALVAGLPTAEALLAVADAMDGVGGAGGRTEVTVPDAADGRGRATEGVRGPADPLRAAAARVRLGADPAEVWAGIPGADALGPIAPVLARATAGGGSVRAALEHAAQRLRAEADAAAVARAERAAVLVAGPLGLCFLPAFVCLGVVPVVIGLADGMLPGVLP